MFAYSQDGTRLLQASGPSSRPLIRAQPRQAESGSFVSRPIGPRSGIGRETKDPGLRRGMKDPGSAPGDERPGICDGEGRPGICAGGSCENLFVNGGCVFGGCVFGPAFAQEGETSKGSGRGASCSASRAHYARRSMRLALPRCYGTQRVLGEGDVFLLEGLTRRAVNRDSHLDVSPCRGAVDLEHLADDLIQTLRHRNLVSDLDVLVHRRHRYHQGRCRWNSWPSWVAVSASRLAAKPSRSRRQRRKVPSTSGKPSARSFDQLGFIRMRNAIAGIVEQCQREVMSWSMWISFV